MIRLDVHEASEQLHKLVDAVQSGQLVLIEIDGIPVVQLLSLTRVSKTREPGGASVTYMAEDFDAEDPAINALFYGEAD